MEKNNMELEQLVSMLPFLARLTGGFASVTDFSGRRICMVDANGQEVGELAGQVCELAREAAQAGRPLAGLSRIVDRAGDWAFPIGNYILTCSNDERVKKEHKLRASLERALPMIARVAGGEAVLFNEKGERLFVYNAEGTERIQYKGKTSQQARQAIEAFEPEVGKSFSISGAMAVRIPITENFGLGFNNEKSTRQQQKLYEEVKRLQQTRFTFDDIIGETEAIVKAKHMAKFVADGFSSILLYGETGTGKEMFAQSIHNASERCCRPFVALNCGALPASLIESNLFGYEEGAFTGAKKGGSTGVFEQANGGTIFLDEISEMEISLQTKLLRVLQEREVVRIGGGKPIKVDVRVIASTNKEINYLISEGKFREDLFYRLNVIQIKVPPLRERVEDIALLASHFVQQYNKTFGKFIEDIAIETMKILQSHHWPGNIRELQNCIEYAMNMVKHEEKILSPKHLPAYLRSGAGGAKESVVVEIQTGGNNLNEALRETERAVIKRTLEVEKYKKVKVAQVLGISTTTLWRKIAEYGLEKEAE
ncbi:Arginine utilization regulatory protein RocR [Pelotomaculum schinkii]|uniref:Arginine utilization regulatory protein RocR n=1 Tax=Pelotomaculum schinkii TaxID=78350 RepID=A0A4Y7RE36_9FIRM|nr:sigma 54-interacting transcriptional regulator [Pelotomaculum schinkii]TEB07278.1 Arginine utilization regulatory protein RocR [Pelotomaculum schinkii]